MKKVLILGDSLTFGRPKYQVWNKDTWPALIEREGYNIFHRGKGGADSRSVLSEAVHLDNYMIDSVGIKQPFDICIIQVGIVDCTPRLVSRKVERIITLIPIIKTVFAKLGRIRSLVEFIGTPWVSIIDFEKNCINIFETCSRLATRVIFIEIAKPAHFLIHNCGDYSENVTIYNDTLRGISKDIYLSIYDDVNLDAQLLPDGHHLTKIGHQNVANKILAII